MYGTWTPPVRAKRSPRRFLVGR